MRDSTKKYKKLSRRAFFTFSFKTALFGLLAWRFYDLQVLQKDKFSLLSEKNYVRVNIIPPVRGIIVDRNDKIIVSNKDTYSLITQEKDVQKLSQLIYYVEKLICRKTKLTTSSLTKTTITKIKNSQRTIIDDSLNWQEIVKLETSMDQDLTLPKYEIVKTYKRLYTGGEIFCHITGYTAKPTSAEVKKVDIPNYREFYIGKTGVEKIFNDALQGTYSVEKIAVNSRGECIEKFGYINGKTGDKLQLTIDSDVQITIANAMTGCTGGVIVTNPTTGEILGLYSSPTYDPNKFIDGIRIDDWQKLIKNDYNPLINRCIHTVYPPGSIFKIVTTLAILQSQINSNESIFCTGEHKVADRVFHCNKAHGYVNLSTALERSCNIYFYIYSQRIGIQNIHKAGATLGLGKSTGIELPSESAGLLPNKQWKRQKYKQNWQLGDTVNTSIGQGYTNVTLIQLSMMLSKLLTGLDIKPQLNKANIDTAQEVINLSQEHRLFILNGLNNVFKTPEGSGYRKKSIYAPDIDIAGKTGTAQVISQRKATDRRFAEHGLFLGFAPYNQPKYTVAVVVENAGWGMSSAFPVAANIFKTLLV